MIQKIEPRRPHPLPWPPEGVVPGRHHELRVARVVQNERELASHLTCRPRDVRQPELAAVPAVRVDPDDVAGRLERRSAGECHIQIGRVGPDAQYERVDRCKHGERPPHSRVAAGRGGRVRRRPAVLAHEPVVLLRVLHVVPQTTPLRRDFQVDRHPRVLEPFVEPREQHSPCRSRRAHLPREPRVDVRHRALVVPAVAHPVGL